jgi:hypothetical protein
MSDENIQERQYFTLLLNLANDMRALHNDQKLDDLPTSVPQDQYHCIIANAFNYGCTVEPGEALITFKSREDVEAYLKVMGFSYNYLTSDNEYGEDEGWLYVDDYGEYRAEYYEAPMTPELVDIAEQFDTGTLFREYSEYWVDEHGWLKGQKPVA